MNAQGDVMRKSKVVKTIVVAAIAIFAISASIQSSFAATKTTKSISKTTSAKKAAAPKIIKDINLFISADTNIDDLWVKTLVPAFKAKHPEYKVNVIFDLHGLHDAQTTAKITAATVLKKDPGIDIIDAGLTVQLGTSGLLYPVNTKNVPNLKDVPKSVFAAGQGGIPYRGSSVLLAYNSTNVPTPPKTLDDLLTWIKAHPGKFTYNAPNGGGSGYSFVQTVVDKFVPEATRRQLVADIHPELEGAWDAGLEVLRQLNTSTFGMNGTYPSNNAATLNLLATGQVDMGTVWSDQFTTASRTGAMPSNIKVAQISNPSFTGGASYFGVPLAAKNARGALVLANWVLSAEAQDLIMGGTLNGYPVIPLSKLNPALAANFKDADIGNLRAGYLSANANDLKTKWASTVPGK